MEKAATKRISEEEMAHCNRSKHMERVACIKFSENAKSKIYRFESMELQNGEFCVVDSDGEEATGFVATIEVRCFSCQGDVAPYPSVLRKASEEEIENWRRLKEREQRYLLICREKTRKHHLPMSISAIRISEKQNKITFYFTADRRIDFRELVKDLASTLRARIELWQIGVRDEAKNMGGYGICGCQLCCASWIDDFKAVSIRMAKNQELTLSPSKLSGLCGRLMCCIQYEDEQYRAMSAEMPPLGSVIQSLDVTGEVVDRNLLGQWLAIRIDSGEVYQVFSREIQRVISRPNHDNTNSNGEDDSSDVLPDEDDEAEARPSGNGRASRNGGARSVAQMNYASRGGVPPRPPASKQREEDERRGKEEAQLKKSFSNMEAQTATSATDSETEGPTTPSAAESTDDAERSARRRPKKKRGANRRSEGQRVGSGRKTGDDGGSISSSAKPSPETAIPSEKQQRQPRSEQASLSKQDTPRQTQRKRSSRSRRTGSRPAPSGEGRESALPSPPSGKAPSQATGDRRRGRSSRRRSARKEGGPVSGGGPI